MLFVKLLETGQVKVGQVERTHVYRFVVRVVSIFRTLATIEELTLSIRFKGQALAFADDV